MEMTGNARIDSLRREIAELTERLNAVQQDVDTREGLPEFQGAKKLFDLGYRIASEFFPKSDNFYEGDRWVLRLHGQRKHSSFVDDSLEVISHEPIPALSAHFPRGEVPEVTLRHLANLTVEAGAEPDIWHMASHIVNNQAVRLEKLTGSDVTVSVDIPYPGKINITVGMRGGRKPQCEKARLIAILTKARIKLKRHTSLPWNEVSVSLENWPSGHLKPHRMHSHLNVNAVSDVAHETLSAIAN